MFQTNTPALYYATLKHSRTPFPTTALSSYFDTSVSKRYAAKRSLSLWPRVWMRHCAQYVYKTPVGMRGTLALGGLAAVVTSPFVFYSQAFNQIKRFFRSAYVAVGIGMDYKYSLANAPIEAVEQKDMLRQVHLRSARKLVKLFKKQGGVYVKIGQHLSTLFFVLPEEYTTTFAELYNQCTPVSYDKVALQFRRDFGAEPSELFAHFDEEPIAAASLGQVHVAETLQGQRVAIKVQYPDVSDKAWTDVRTITFLTKIASKVFPNYKFSWLIREMNANLPSELDFQHEARNAQELAQFFKDDPSAHTPFIYEELTSANILTQEYIGGVFVDDLHGIRELGLSPKVVAKQVNKLFNTQIFQLGFVHCDPHAGNIKIRKTPEGFQVVLLDSGLCKRYDQDFRFNYSNLWLAILKHDEPGIAKYAKYLGIENFYLFASMITATPWQKKGDKVELELGHEVTKSSMADNIGKYLDEITQILQDAPSALVLLLKTNDLLRMINKTLGVSPASYMRSMLYHCAYTNLQIKLERNDTTYGKMCTYVEWVEFNVSIVIARLYLSVFEWLVSLSFY